MTDLIVQRLQPDRQATLAALLLLLLALTGLYGCEPGAVRPDEARLEQLLGNARLASERGDHLGAAATYNQLAQASRGAQRDEYLLAAAREWNRAGVLGRAVAALDAMERPVDPAATPDLALLGARLALQQNQPERCLARLAALGDPLPEALATDALELRASALFLRGEVPAALESLRQRELWLEDPAQVLANHRLIFDGLRQSLGRGMPLGPPPDDDPELAGWIELAERATILSGDPLALRAALMEWRAANPRHPASAGLIDELLASVRAVLQYPVRVGLLLPLSGRLRGAGMAVRDGVIAAYYRQPTGVPRPELLIYDTEALGPVGAYGAAVRGGADLILGPLSKDSAAAVAANARSGLTTLALNYLPDGSTSPASFYQFSLAPEDEAAQAAERALADGLLSAGALVPLNSWGGRMLEAFSAAFENGGGRLLSHDSYTPGGSDFTAPITRLLHLDFSRARHRELRGITRLDLQFEPRRRRDIEFLFLAARPAEARLLRPQLKFHYASDLPVYASSTVYEPGSGVNIDLDGILFVDMPWMIAPDPQAAELQSTLSEFWPAAAGSRSRLYAMGMDAYCLAPLLYNDVDLSLKPFQGATGELRTDRQRRIHRRLVWARMVDGQPRLAPPEAAPVMADDAEVIP